MKKVVGLLVAILGFVVIQPVQAEEPKSIAIIDTAIDSNKNTNVVYEACFTLKSCANGTSFQEGKGSANVNDWTVKGIDHGYNISQAAVLSNPTVKIVFIRISDINVYPTFSAIHNDGTSIARAIDWVSKNASRLNIGAVSISQSRVNFTAGTCPTDTTFESAVANLNVQKIPTFVATGNDGKTNQVGFPACVNGVIGVGSVKPDLNFASYTNRGPGLDVVARGDADVISYKGVKITIVGTSVASPIVASKVVNQNSNGDWNSFFSSLPKAVSLPYISK